MAWQYSALQNKVISIQSQLAIKMDSKSNCSDQLMPMNVTHNVLHDGGKTVAQKRKAEDFFINIDSSKSLRSSYLMLDMYTQTDNTVDVSLNQIYDLVRTNSERIQRVEDMVTKLCNMIGALADSTPPQTPQVGTISCPEKKSTDSSPVETRPQLTQYQAVSNSNLTPSEYVTQAPQQTLVSTWDESQIRHDDLSTSISETGLSVGDVNTSLVKTPPKVNWGGDGASITAGEQPPGIGCWLGDPSNVHKRAWFSGNPTIITKCESYGLNPVKLALALTEALFTREEMAASNVRGTRGKDTLDPSKIKAIRAHVDHKFPIEEDRMELRWQLIKPKLDSKCRSQRRLQREHKWKMEKLLTAKPEVPTTPRSKRLVIGEQEKEMLLYGVSKTVVNVYTENNADTTPFPETQEGYLPVNSNE